MASILEIETPHGLARVHLYPVAAHVGALVLGHGAGGGVEAPDLVAATKAACSAGLTVALMEQPYRVAGRRSPAPANQLDAAWRAVVSELRSGPLSGIEFLLTGGRSAGARVACRTAADTDSRAVLCLAFPLHPPGRPEKSRLDELDALDVPVLIVQGESDPFGMPPEGPNRTVARTPGTHSLRDGASVTAAVSDWLAKLIP
jgi:hypothetical protein